MVNVHPESGVLPITHADIINRLGATAHDLGREARFLRDRDIRSAGRDDEDVSFKNRLSLLEYDHPGQLMVDGTRIQTGKCPADLWFRSRRQ